MDQSVREQVKRKFDISFVIAKEHLPFSKYPAIHDLEAKHGVDLGTSYKNHDSARNFVHYNPESQRQSLKHSLESCNFFRVLMDGSTDKGKVENELFVILFCKQDQIIQEVRSCARYLCVLEPKKSDADGLLRCLSDAMKSMGIDDVLQRESVLSASDLPVLVGCVLMVLL